MSARDKAIDELASALGKDRVEVSAIVDLLVLASVHEAGARVAESLIEPLATALVRHADGVQGILHRARRELGEVPPSE